MFMEQVNERNALVAVIGRIMSQLGLAQKLGSSLEDGLIKSSPRISDANKDTFDNNISKISKISKLPADFLVEASGSLLSTAAVGKIDSNSTLR